MNLLLDHISVLAVTGDATEVQVTGVEHDSRRVRPGDLFCCLPGTVRDGHDFAPEAVRRGAVGLLCEHPVDDPAARGVVQATVGAGRARPSMARLAAAFYGFPADELLMAGVTGTNGKTTVTHLLAAILDAAGRPATVIGTLSGARTTPEATDLQASLAAVRDEGRAAGARPAVAMEVSSHALAQSRVDAVTFDVAVFTNLSHDHLDFHGSMEDYFAAKAALFTPERARRAVVWVDDAYGARLAATTAVPVVPVGRADAAAVTLEWGRSRFTWRGLDVALALSGRLNVDNALLAAEAAVVLGVAPPVAAEALGRAAPVPGRLELVTPTTGDAPFTVVVDYAHTPAALEAVLDEARALTPGGRVLVVFGSGGDRDRAKRPAMGAAAATRADVAVVTSDNPRHEDPDSIIEAVVAGAPAERRPTVVTERGAAIRAAVDEARPGDVVVIAGKGHERSQQVGDELRPFDDAAEARAALGARFGGAGR